MSIDVFARLARAHPPLIALSLAVSTNGAEAQGVSPPTQLPPVVVTSPKRPPRGPVRRARIAPVRPAPDAPAAATSNPPVTQSAGTLTAPSVEQHRQALNQVAGSVAFVDVETVRERFTNTLRDVLKDVPGVFIQERYGQEQRISVRGSGSARGFHLRGIELLQDGIPVNLADGSGDNYQLDPLAFRTVEVYKGGNALAFGSSTLGGAINFITPTAYTALAPNLIRLEAGSFGTIRANMQVSRIVGDFDFLTNATVTHSDGYRDHSRQQAEQFNGNVGWRINPNVETRFYWGAYVVDQRLPGSLSLGDALTNPRMANPVAVSGDQSRETRTERLANRTSIKFDIGQLDLDSWFIHKHLQHPIFQVIDQDGVTYGVAPRFTADLNVGGYRDQLITGLRFIGGNNIALQFVNLAGREGAQTLNSRQNAYNYDVFAENRFFVAPSVALVTGFKALHDERIYEDKGGLALNPTPKSDSRAYDLFNPKLGVLWEPWRNVQVFADLTRSADVPDFTDLTQTTGATTKFVPLRAQGAWTAEIGTRGRYDRVSWDVTLYRSVVRDELLQFTISPSAPASTFNAERTVHQGVELGFGVEAGRNLLAPGDTLTVSQVWTYNDFRFVDDAQYGRNRLAAIPDHVLRTVVSYRHPSGFYLAPQFDWTPQGAYADYANTLRAPGYALVGLQTGYQFANGTLLYAEARNLADKRYVSDVSAITDATKAATQVFYPGSGRSLYGGVRLTF